MKKTILILNNHGLGDVVMSFSFFISLLNNEESRLIVIFKSKVELELFTLTKFYSKNNSRFILYEMKQIKKLFRYIFRIKQAFSLGVNEKKSVKLFKFLFIKDYYIANPYKYEIAESSNILNNKEKQHKSLLYRNLLDIKDYSDIQLNKDFFIGKSGSKINGKYIVFASGSGELEKQKRWVSSGYRKLLLSIMKNTNYKVVFVGSVGEQTIVEEIISNIDKKILKNILQLNGKTKLIELIEVLRSSELVIGNDNGILHIASAVNANILGLFGPTDYNITGPIGDYVNIIDNRIDCAPCYGKEGNIKGCDDNICMKNIDAERVFKKVEEKLSK